MADKGTTFGARLTLFSARLTLVRAAGAAYYVATGIWPLLHMASFELITGPKRDKWLVNTVGVLVAVIGAAQLRAARRPPAEMRQLSAGVALGLAAIELYYWRRGTISIAYPIDALGQLALAAAWLTGGSQPPRCDAQPNPAGPVPVSRGPARRPGKGRC